MDPRFATLSTVENRPVLRFERPLTHHIEKVWKAITDPTEMAHWFPARVETELAAGATMQFTFEGQEESTTKGQILEIDPPRLYVYRWGDDVLRWELIPDGPGCRLIFTHTVSESGGGRLAAGRNAAGWDECLAALLTRLDGQTWQPTQSKIFDRIQAYADRFGLSEGTISDHPDGYLVRFEQDLVWRAPQDVWALLTDQHQGGAAEPVVGTPPPTGFTTDEVPAGPVTEVEPPAVLEYEWLNAGKPVGRVRWEITTHATKGNRLTLTQTVPSTLPQLRPRTLAAWQVHLEGLFARLHGTTSAASANRRRELERVYAGRLG